MGRVLGESRMAEVPSRLFGVFTGVNIATAGDFNSRILHTILIPDVEHPENRAFNRNLKSWSIKHRPKVLEALLTILHAGYQPDAMDRLTEHTPSRFPQWDEQVRRPLVHAGGEDPLQLLMRNAETDPTVATEGLLLLALWTMFGNREFGAAEVQRRAENSWDQDGELTEHTYWQCDNKELLLRAEGCLVRCFNELHPKTKMNPRSWGRTIFGPMKDNILGGRVLRGEMDRTRTMSWWVEVV